MTVLEPKDGISHRGHHSSVNDGEAGVFVGHHEEPFVFRGLNSGHCGSNSNQSLFHFVQWAIHSQLLGGSQWLTIETVIGE